MKIFISWSGERSRELAELLAGWIPNVIQSVECFFSSTGIRAGDRWNEEINTQLEATDFGILCVTPANIGAPWLNYEAGALAKRVNAKSRVVPISMGFAPGTLPAPLRQFNGVKDDEAGFLSLITSIAEAANSTINVDDVFGVWWPVLAPKLADLPDPTDETTPPAPPSTDEVLSEVLGIVQGLQKEVGGLRDRGRYADPAQLTDIVALARMMIHDPGLQDRLASGDLRTVRNALNHARGSSKFRSDWSTLTVREFERAREAEEDAARMSAAEDAGDDTNDEIFDPEHGDTAVFPGKTIG